MVLSRAYNKNVLIWALILILMISVLNFYFRSQRMLRIFDFQVKWFIRISIILNILSSFSQIREKIYLNKEGFWEKNDLRKKNWSDKILI